MFNLFEDVTKELDSEESLPEELPILPLRGTVAFPFIIMPLSIGVPRSTKLIKTAVQNIFSKESHGARLAKGDL